MVTYPVLLWHDNCRRVTGLVIGDFHHTTAHGPTRQDVLRQLQEALRYAADQLDWYLEPELTEPELRQIKVEVRAQYWDEAERRLIPSPHPIQMRVPCVSGQDENGLLVCEVPHFNLWFHYHREEEWKELVRHYVRDRLAGNTPSALAMLMPPADVWLDQIHVKPARDSSRPIPLHQRKEMEVLHQVADPLLHDRTERSAAYERETTIAMVIRKLAQERANILLVGEAGCGKSTILTDAARRIAREEIAGEDREMRTWRYWRGNGARMIAGMRYLGQWEERCEAFIERLAQIEGVYCVENLLELLRVGGADAHDSVAAFLLPYLERRDLRMAAEATPAEVEACRRLMPALLDQFQIIEVPPFTEPEARQVLEKVAEACANADQLQFLPGSVALAHRLFRRFQPGTAFPGPAAGFLRALAEQSARRPLAERKIAMDDVIALFVRRTGLPELLVRDEIPLPAAEVTASLAAEIIGQPDAIEAASRVVAGIKAGMTDPERPEGVLLFCGPTGVGKTALARALAHFCFEAGEERERLVRLDMSEYSGWDAAHRFLQAPDGHTASWIQKIRRQPFSLVLFDEIEKAAPEVFDLMLGLLDEGRLTDRYGRVTNFRSAILILTSNLGVQTSGSLGFDPGGQMPEFEGAVRQFFRPEFFNRLDGIVTFRPLARGDVKRIASKELHDLARREGLAADGLTLEWDESVVEMLVAEGYDERLGARPLQRAMERHVVTPLAKWRLAEGGNAGRIRLAIEGGELRIVRLSPPPD